jgi:hypothetical protein
MTVAGVPTSRIDRKVPQSACAEILILFLELVLSF